MSERPYSLFFFRRDEDNPEIKIPVPVFMDEALTTEHANPVYSDAFGVMPKIYLAPEPPVSVERRDAFQREQE